MKKVIIWGSGGTGKRICSEIAEKYGILAFVDSDKRKWGGKIDGIPVRNPEDEIKKMDFDYVIIASQPGYGTICQKLLGWGVDEDKIISKYVEQPLVSRIQFLKDMSGIIHREKIQGACAEAGVFEGDFAKHMNALFPDRNLYLFDTFEGFDEKDVAEEEKMGVSEAKSGDYRAISIDVVIKKMRHPEKVIIRKGYFPDTAIDVTEKFCFINLDLDLYRPTINGLRWAREHMCDGGVILVHDYYSDTFFGPQRAVDEFMKENSIISKYPIGDGLSIMLTGF